MTAQECETNTDDQPKVRSFIVRNGNDIDDDGIKYLVRRRWVMGSINIIFSRPGRGKSTMAADLAGRVSTGRKWLDGSRGERGAVLYLKGEGSDASIRDRLRLADADFSRIGIVGRADTADDDESPMIDLANDIAPLMRAVEQVGDDAGEPVRLIIVDTLDSMFPSMRMIDNANIRKCLWPLQELAEQTGICVIVLAHTNKGGYADPLDRLSGGRAIGAAARSIWYLGKTHPDADHCVMAEVKINDFLPAKSINFAIASASADTPGAIRWGDLCDTTAAVLDQQPKQNKGGKSEECGEWLTEKLADGPVELDVVKREAGQLGFGDYVMRKVRQELGIKSVAAKGMKPTAYYYCGEGQSPPDLTPVGNIPDDLSSSGSI